MSLKSPLSYEEQIERLESRGLEIGDREQAINCLRHHNYYRLSIYARAYSQEHDHDEFLPGTRFEDIWKLYDFDFQLQRMILHACREVELSVRARWAYEIAHLTGSLGWQNPDNFTSDPKHTKLLSWFDERFAKSEEQFVTHYKAKQIQRPEVWIAVELFDFGVLSKFYSLTKDPAIRKSVAATYDHDQQVFLSILRHLSFVRNVCAHYGRLWDRGIQTEMQIPQKRPADIQEDLLHEPPPNEAKFRRIYNTLVVLSHLMERIAPEANWTHKLAQHLMTCPEEFSPMMGFPENWRARPMWIRALGG